MVVPTQAPAAAERLRCARQERLGCAPVRDLIGIDDLDLAYEVQQIQVRAALDRGRRLIGRKIGLTSPAVQAQFGVHQPDFGVLFDHMWMQQGRAIDRATLIAPRIEAEIAFHLAEDLDGREVSASDVVAASDWVAPAFEIVDSRIANWDITITDTIADNASAGLFVLGEDRMDASQLGLAGLESVQVTVRRDGTEVSSGTGEACMGNPAFAMAWLANELAGRGTPLRSGDLVLSGALGPMVAVDRDCTFSADFGLFGAVRAIFERGNE